MGKVIAIGQAVLDVVFSGNTPVKAFAGGRIANMAASLGKMGVSTEYVSECATDAPGDAVVEFLRSNHVGTASVDRFTEGQSQVSLVFRDGNGNERYSCYSNYPPTRFDVLWPHIDEGDIVVFGSDLSIEASLRKPLLELLEYARERKAVTIYLPGFRPELCSRITRVMPSILENLEFADIVMARESDMLKIFGKSDPEECYDEHISFYCRNFVFTSGNLDIYLRTQSEKLRIEHTSHVPANMLGWNASFCAGFVKGLLDSEASHRPDNLGSDDLRRIVELATACAADSITTGENVVSEEFVKTLK
ncbi:MAG TPA: hypothetical protein IAC93_05235 [Candidatus Limisoma gallistercoris]|nr:hypothetical protein [Candidatus Limisoma gallistercoris]